MPRRHLLASLLLAAACSSGTLRGVATLDGATDSSGILVSLAGPRSAVTTTAADGSYQFAHLPDGDYAVVATADGTLEGSLTTSAPLSQGELASLLFHPVGAITGHVTRGGATTGCSGIVVVAQGSSGVATTDDSGAFELDGITPGSHDLNAYTSGYLQGTARGVMVTRGQTTAAPDIDLTIAPVGDAAGTLIGQARLAGGADPAGITVSLVGTSLSTVTAADGSFALPNPPQGIYGLAFDRGVYHELAPSVLAIPGATGFYLDGSLYATAGTVISLARGQRQMSASIQAVQLSPHGDYLLFTEYVPPLPGATGSYTRLYSLPISGGTPVKLADILGGYSWVYSPDGTHLAFTTYDADNFIYDLYTAAVDGSDVRQLATGVQPYVRYSPAGRYLIVGPGYNYEQVDAVPVDGSAMIPIGTGYEIGNVNFSPTDDESLLLTNCTSSSVTGQCALMRAPIVGGAPTQIADMVSWYAVDAQWSHVAYMTTTQLYLYDLKSGVSTPVGGGSADVSAPGMFTRDGAYLVFLSGVTSQTDMGELDSIAVTASPSATPTTLATNVVIGTSAISAGGTQIYIQDYAARDTRSVPVAGGPVQSLGTNISPYGAFAFSPRGAWVTMLTDYDAASATATLWLAPAETASFTRIAGSVLTQNALAFSPDESTLAYLADDGHLGKSGNVMTVPTAGGSATQIAAGAATLRGFSPSGALLLYGSTERVPTTWVAPAVPTAGSSPLALLETSTQAFFIDDNVAVGVRQGTAAPFDFQDGLYLLSVQP